MHFAIYISYVKTYIYISYVKSQNTCSSHERHTPLWTPSEQEFLNRHHSSQTPWHVRLRVSVTGNETSLLPGIKQMGMLPHVRSLLQIFFWLYDLVCALQVWHITEQNLPLSWADTQVPSTAPTQTAELTCQVLKCFHAGWWAAAILTTVQ